MVWRSTSPPVGVVNNEVHPLPVVRDRLPFRSRSTLVGLGLAAPAQKLDHGRHEPVLTTRAISLGRPELLAPPVDVDGRPADVSRAGIEVEVLPCDAEHFGDAPALQEQQRHRGAEAVVRHGREQRPRLIAVEREARRIGDPQRLDGPYRVPDERAHLHGLVDHLGQGLAMMPDRPGAERERELRLPLRHRPVVELADRQVPERLLDAPDPVRRLGPRRRADGLAVHVVQPPLGQHPDRVQPA
jgi:hypothetical protein